MKTIEQVLENFKSRRLDERDTNRLVEFFPEELLPRIGVTLKPEFVGNHVAIEWTRDNILEQLREDVAFGFEKALDQRSNSAEFMYNVVQMWNEILEEGLEDFDDYKYYGLPLFKATALKYGFENPIGADSGSEIKYQG